MKTNGSMLHGGRLKPEYRGTWARYFVRFVEEYEKAGVPIWGLTVQNEPMASQTWESCLFTAEEERDFVRDQPTTTTCWPPPSSTPTAESRPS
jgi:glucosylceramidase